ncbi:MAG: hypothetical protein VX836_07355 [Pseudomonadota bacterium]|nr:hypothetical protein [Pseudomonadota bacterium]
MNDQGKSFAAMNEQGADLGNFYPVGHIVAAFPTREAALAVQKSLQGKGYTADETRYLSPETVVEGTQRGLDSAGLLSMLGSSLRMVQLYHDLAEKGRHFLLIHAPDERDDEQVMSVIREQPHELAQKYHRLTVESLGGELNPTRDTQPG